MYRNVEAALGGKVSADSSGIMGYLDSRLQSDPYVRVQIHNVTVGRTEVVNNSEALHIVIFDSMR